MLMYNINDKLTRDAIKEVGTPRSRYFVSVAYNFFETDKENRFIDSEGYPTQQPSVQGVHRAFHGFDYAKDVFNEIEMLTVENSLYDIAYPSSVTLEGPNGEISHRFLKQRICFTELKR